MIELDETFCTAHQDIIDTAHRLLEFNLDQSLAKIVHDNVTLKICGNRVTVFAMVGGGHSRMLFSFRCVFQHCSAFMDVRTLPMPTASSGSSWGFPTTTCLPHSPSVPRGIFTTASKEALSAMAFQNASRVSIKLRNDIPCSKNILQNALR